LSDKSRILGTCYLVFGMHRSGTSLLARLLNIAGIELPENVLGPHPSNPDGHYEPEHLIHYNEYLLNQNQSNWSDTDRQRIILTTKNEETTKICQQIFKTIISEYEDKSRFLLKEPRITLLLVLYTDYLQSVCAKVINIAALRHPLDVANSLLRRNGIPLSDGVNLWLRYNSEIAKFSENNDIILVEYEKLTADWRSVLTQPALQLDDLSVEQASFIDQIVRRPKFASQTVMHTAELDCNPILAMACDAYVLLKKKQFREYLNLVSDGSPSNSGFNSGPS
jgi:hypothetical protein